MLLYVITQVAVSVSGTDEGSDFGFAITDLSGATVLMGGADFDGVGCFDLDGNCYSVSLSSADGNGPIAGTLTVGVQSFDWGESISSWFSTYTEVMGNGCPVYGCTDSTACNFDEGADDDGSCDFVSCGLKLLLLQWMEAISGEVSWTITDCDGTYYLKAELHTQIV